MSLYKDASLVMIPSAYKDGRLYSIRPVEELGSELVTNGDFDTDSNWTKGTGWSIANGYAESDGTTSNLDQTGALTTGKTYKAKVTISNMTTGTLSYRIGSNSGDEVLNITQNGTYTAYGVAGNSTIRFRSQSGFDGRVDNVSVKEVITNGDFDFSRGSNLAATRVDVNGLIEKGRENLLLQSNQFDTTWATYDTSVANGQGGYDGTNDAWLLSIASATGFQTLRQYVSNSGAQTFSIYAKAGALNWMRINTGVSNTYFDIANGAIGADSSIGASIESAGNGYYRCSVPLNGSITFIFIYPAFDNNNPNQTSGNIYIQDSQLEAGLVATDYIETGASTAQAGILEDMPRLDYSGSCPALLLEPQRSNLLNHGEYFGAWTLQAGGTGSAPVLEANTTDTLSPEGKYNAYKVTFNVGSGTTTGDESIMYRSKSGLTAGSDHTASVYLKGESGGEEVIVRDTEGSYKKWTLTTEWARYDYTQVAAAPSYATSFGIRQGVAGIINSDAVVYMYGFQSELGSYPTSYIPTYGSSVTRSRDTGSLNMITAGITTGWTSATLFIEYEKPNTGEGVDTFRMHGTSVNGRAYIYNTGNGFAADWAISGGHTLNTNVKHIWRLDSLSEGTRFKNGAKENLGSGTAWSDIRYMYLNNQGLGGTLKIKQIVLFPTALTDSECIALTTI